MHGKQYKIERNRTIYSSFTLDDTIKKYEDLVKKIIIVAEVVTAMIRLLNEIEKPKRRVKEKTGERKKKRKETKRIQNIKRKRKERKRRVKKVRGRRGGLMERQEKKEEKDKRKRKNQE